MFISDERPQQTIDDWFDVLSCSTILLLVLLLLLLRGLSFKCFLLNLHASFCLSLWWLKWEKRERENGKSTNAHSREQFFFYLIAMSIFFYGYFRETMINGENTDPQLSNTYLDNIIKQLEISDGSQATSSVRYVPTCQWLASNRRSSA